MSNSYRPQKSLGQHWLFDEEALAAMLSAGEVSGEDVVLEIGPGLGSLTSYLTAVASKVIAVEADEELATGLKTRVPLENLEVITGDILEFDTSKLPKGYKVVANIPYYITSKILQNFLEADNQPLLMALLVQKELAERVVATPGDMSVLAFSVQYYAKAKMLGVVPKELFDPMPKVDSSVLQVRIRNKPYFPADTKELFRLVKAGFGERRKQLANSLAGGLRIDKDEAITMLEKANIASSARAQELSMEQWQQLYKQYCQK
ncbi:MAG: 16S rRNA (adenine(1518)-N(6)/adenine(1519)-N(6))-dimethyltransferase RsmA [Candidatus Saccharimonadales bacterium]